jgi:hypothetical protein
MALHKPLVDSVEIALIELQYALADYYSRSEIDAAADSGVLDETLRELRNNARSAQLAIDLICQIQGASGKVLSFPEEGRPRKNSFD